MRSPGQNPRSFIDDSQGFFNESAIGFVRWCDLSGVSNNSISQQFNDDDDRECKEALSIKYSLEECLAYFNSKLFEYELNADRRSNIHIYPDDWRKMKIPSTNSTLLKELATEMIFKVEDFERVIKGFLKYLLSMYSIYKTSRKLESWHNLEFPDFIKELNKAINKENRARRKNDEPEIDKLTKKDEFEWMELFEENKKKAQALQSQIDATEKEIDRMVYELYGLTEEEIAIVEGSHS